MINITKNVAFNKYLEERRQQNLPCEPLCGCGKDLTDSKVFSKGSEWVCAHCLVGNPVKKSDAFPGDGKWKTPTHGTATQNTNTISFNMFPEDTKDQTLNEMNRLKNKVNMLRALLVGKVSELINQITEEK